MIRSEGPEPQTERELLESRRLFKLVLDSIPARVFWKDCNLNYLGCNRAFAADAGLASPAEIVGKNDFDMSWREQAELYRADDRAVIASGNPKMNYEEPETTPDGRTNWLRTSKIPLLDESGIVCGVLGTYEEITGRKRAEIAFHKLFENSPVGIYRTTPEGRIQLANPALVRMLGYDSFEELAARDLEAAGYEPGYDRANFKRAMEEQGEVRGRKERWRRKDGSFLILRENAKANRDASGAIVSYEGTVEDITDQTLAEEALHESEAKYKALIETTNTAYVILDSEARVVDANAEYVRLTGRASFDQIAGKSIREWTAKHDLERNSAAFEGFLKQSHVRSLEVDHIDEQGNVIPVEINATLVQSGAVRQVLAVLRDISGRKAAEAEKFKLEEELRQAKKLESIGRLAGGIAHDFNNLLTLINCYADFIVNGLPENHPLREDALQVLRAGERAAALTGQLLAFSRKQVIRPRPLNLNAIVAETEDMLRRLVGEDIELMVSLDPRLGQVLADPGQIHQILMNLAANARDAMPDGGELFIETSNVEIDGDLAAQHPETAPGHYILLTVTDTGQGMDPATGMQIFEPFFTTKGLGKGTGLGLSTVYGIVRQSSGWIGVQSEPGKGASFRIYLPRISAAPSPNPSRESAPATLTGGETVLIVEDQKEVLQLAKTTLKSYGYRVLEAAHAEEAILVSGGYPGPIDILVTDVVLPGMNGRELAGRLAASRPEMKVLFVSGYAADVIGHRGVLDSGVEYLPKPFSPDGLAAKLREVLGPRTPPH
jgi:PAS domain S-box-containing protein